VVPFHPHFPSIYARKAEPDYLTCIQLVHLYAVFIMPHCLCSHVTAPKKCSPSTQSRPMNSALCETNFVYIVLPMFLCYTLILGLSVRLRFGIPNITSNYTAQRSSDNFTTIPNAHAPTHALYLLDSFFTQYDAVHASTLYVQKITKCF
jgi:hypothetical protein